MDDIYFESRPHMGNVILILAFVLGIFLFIFDTSQAPKNLLREAYFINHIVVGFSIMILPIILLYRQRPGYYKLYVSEDMLTIKKGTTSKHITKSDLLTVTPYFNPIFFLYKGILICYGKTNLSYFLVPDRFNISKESVARKINERLSINIDNILNESEV